MNYILLIIAIVMANFITSVLACAIMLNRKVLKAYIKYATKIGEEVSEEILDEMLE